MDKLYLILILSLPLIVAIIAFAWGMDEAKESEDSKALLSRVVYYVQFITSIVALFILKTPSDISYKFVHLKDYHFDLMFSLKNYNIALAIVISLVFIVVEKLCFNYLHGEEEHSKFYGLKLLLNFAVMSFLFSSNIDYLFFNWEVIGISSALLISYFYRRNQAVEHSLFAFSIYRFCDAAFLLAGLFLYHFYQTENIEYIATNIPALVLGGLIFAAIMGKSGVWPFSSWLPLALEGPTPSSNLYYMTLSTHMGVIFMIKTYSLWEHSMLAKSVMFGLLLLNIFITSASAKVQTSIKASLAYSALAQVSVILIEVVFGFHTLALVHMSLHIFYRLAQMSNAPSIISQHLLIEKMMVGDIDSKRPGYFYFYALSGFKGEQIVHRVFSLLIYPFILIDIFENKVLNNISNKERSFRLLNGEVRSE